MTHHLQNVHITMYNIATKENYRYQSHYEKQLNILNYAQPILMFLPSAGDLYTSKELIILHFGITLATNAVTICLFANVLKICFDCVKQFVLIFERPLRLS